jgi:hypothetical protein
VNTSWLISEVKAGRLTWLLVDANQGHQGFGLPGDTRRGSQSALSALESTSTSVTLTGGAKLYHLTAR